MKTMLDSVRQALASSPDVKALFAGEDHAAALIGPCLALIARSEPGDSIAREAPGWVNQLLSTYPSGGIYVVVVQASAPPPTEESRRRIDRVYAEFGRGVVAGAMVIEGKGFKAASIRSALSFIITTSRYNYPLKTFATVREGVGYLTSKLPTASGLSTLQIVNGVEDLRVAYEKQVGVFSMGGASAT